MHQKSVKVPSFIRPVVKAFFALDRWIISAKYDSSDDDGATRYNDLMRRQA